MATEVVGIQLELMGADGVKRDLSMLDGLLNNIRGKNNRIEIESNLKQAKADIIAYTGEIEKLKRELKELKSMRSLFEPGSEGARDLEEAIQETNKEIEENRERLWDARQAAREYQYSLKELANEAKTTQKTFSQMFDIISRGAARVGGAMQSLGKALQRISTPMRTFMQGTIFGLGYKFMNLATSGISGAAERYDVFATYEKQLQALGYGEEVQKKFVIGSNEAATALENLEQSVLGLPTGLDEIIAKQKQYLAASGDMEVATKAAIAANNLFLAQGSNARDQLRGERQLRNMLAGGDMTTARWQTVLESMPMAVKAVGDQLGYANDEFRQLLLANKIDQNDFLGALLEVGTSGVIADAANEMKHTLSAATANITNAFRRMGANIISVFDEIFKAAFGKDTIDMIISFKGAIDSFSVGVQNWIKANPEVFINFINAVKSFNWKGLLQGIGDGLADTLKVITKLMNLFSGFGGRGLGYFFAISGPLGSFFTILGGLVKGLRHPMALLGASVGKLLQKAGTGGILGRFAQLFTGSAKAAKATEVARESATFAQTMSNTVQYFGGLMKVAGTVLIASGTGFVAFKSFKSMIKDLGEIINVASSIDWDMGQKVIGGMLGFFALFAMGGYGVGTAGLAASVDVLFGETVIGLITTFAAGIVALDMKLIKSAFNSFRDILTAIDDSIAIISNLRSTTVDISAIGSALEAFNIIYDMLKPQYQGQGIQNMSSVEAKHMATVVESMKDVLTALKGSAEVLSSFGVAPDISSASKNIGDIVQVFLDVFDIYKPLGSGEKPKQAENMKGVTESMISMLEDMLGAIETVNKLSNVRMNTTQLPSIIARFGGIRDMLFETFKLTDGTTVMNGVAIASGRSYKDQASDLGNIADMISAISNTISYMNNMFAAMSGEGAIKSLSDFTKKWIPYSFAIRQISNWWNKGEYGKDTFKGADKFSTNLNHIVTAMGYLGKLVETLDGVKEKLGGRDTNIAETLAKITPFVSELNGVAAVLEGINSTEADVKVTLMNTALEKIKTLIETAKGIDGSAITDANGELHGLAESLSAMGEELGAIAQAWHDGFVNGLNFDGLAEEVASGMESVYKELTPYEVKFYAEGQKIGNQFRKGLSSRLSHINVSSTINIGARLGSVTGIGTLISSVANTIKAAFDGQTIGVNANLGIRRHILNQHFGGPVQYRAHGGSIFSPRGTDTVPIMGTPGEFMMRTKAVDTFGLDFMRKVNSLNVVGAMRSLQARMNGRIGGTKVSTVNNTVNNNQKVTQNVYTDNPNFAFKRTNRYVRALG